MSFKYLTRSLFCLTAVVALLLHAAPAWSNPAALTLTSPVTGSFELEHGQQLRFVLPDCHKVGEGPLYLSFEGRINTQGRYASGGADAMRVAMNGAPVTVELLANKPWYFPFSNTQRVTYYNDEFGLWKLTYYPWDSTRKPDPQVSTYVFDVTNLLRPGDNELTIENTFDAVPGATVELRHFRLYTNDHFENSPIIHDVGPMRHSDGLASFRKKAVAWHEGLDAQLEASIYYQPVRDRIQPVASYSVDYTFDVSHDGLMTLQVNGDTYRFETRVKLPDEEWELLHAAPQDSMWQTRQVDHRTMHLSNDRLALRREIAEHPTHIEIRDTFTNFTAGDLPVGILNTMDGLEVSTLRELRIAGLIQDRFWANMRPGRAFSNSPIVFVGKDHSSASIVVEEDVYRNQASVLAWDATVSVGTDMFYLRPQVRHTMVWKIYPGQQRDYYRTINTLRADWNLYEEIPGLFGFAYPQERDAQVVDDPEATAALLEDTGIEYVGLTPNEFNRDGQRRMLYGNETADRIRSGIETYATGFRSSARAGGADAKFILYNDVHLINTYNEPERLYELDDSVVINYAGEPHPFRPGFLYHVLPRLGSKSFERVMDSLRIYLDEYDFDGIFLDEWSHSNARVSYSHEDGYSALLDESLRIKRKVAVVPLALRDFHVAYAQEAKARGAFLIANHFDATLAAAQLPIVHFAEPTSHHDYKIAAAQIGRTPLSLNLKRTQGVWIDVQELLKRGVLVCFYGHRMRGDHVLKRVYPITVKEVWPGYVIGEDKIVTMVSGQYQLDGQRPLQAYVYGGDAGQFRRMVLPNEAAPYQLDLVLDQDANEVAVIEATE